MDGNRDFIYKMKIRINVLELLNRSFERCRGKGCCNTLLHTCNANLRIYTYTAFAVNWMKKLLYSIYHWVVTFLNLNYDSLP